MSKELIPSARRLVSSLRDLGYSFESAIADLVDNSIEAGATKINIYVRFVGDKSFIVIKDNGNGMTVKALREAMRFGTEREYAQEDLGKFGLGLKTASLSQCRRFTVATRSSNSGELRFCGWDLDQLVKTNMWEPHTASVNLFSKEIKRLLPADKGTAVIWEKLDRVLRYDDPNGAHAKNGILKMCRDLERHIAMIFHRFIEGRKARKIDIYLNDNAIIPWNPFLPNERESKKFDELVLEVTQGDKSGEVKFISHLLPTKSLFSTQEKFRRAGGADGWNQQQGFYIYRANRIVQAGGWSRIRTPDEHLKLARVAIDFPTNLDEAFNVNIAKMRVNLPAAVKGEIADFLSKTWRAADEKYRLDEKDGSRNHKLSISSKRNFIPYSSRKFQVKHLVNSAELIASSRERDVFYSVLLRIIEYGRGE